MNRERATALAEQLDAIALRLEQAEDDGRKRAANNLPGDLAKDARLVDVFVTQWLRGAAKEAVSQIRAMAECARDTRTRRRSRR